MKLSQNSKFKIQNSARGGFTLVELIVSMALFTVVLLGATGAMLSMMDANRKAQSIRSAMDGLGFALDDIGRSVRVGWNFECLTSAPSSPLTAPTFKSTTVPIGNSCPSTGSPGVKIEIDTGVVAYYFDAASGKIKKTFTPPSGLGGYSDLDLTPDGVTLTSLTNFYVFGNQSLDSTANQPRVTISLEGNAGTKTGLKSNFKIETTVTARLPGAQGG